MKYIEPDCHVIALDIENVTCSSQEDIFDPIDQTEIWEIDSIEFLI